MRLAVLAIVAWRDLIADTAAVCWVELGVALTNSMITDIEEVWTSNRRSQLLGEAVIWAIWSTGNPNIVGALNFTILRKGHRCFEILPNIRRSRSSGRLLEAFKRR